MEWDTACRAKDDSFLSFVITWYAGATSSLWPPPPPPPPNNSIHPKKIIIPVSIHSNAFVPLFKFETSWSLFCRLSRGFVAISGASNLRFSWNCSRHGLPTVYSYLVVLIFFVSNLVQNYFSRFIQDCHLLLLFLSSKSLTISPPKIRIFPFFISYFYW